MNNIIDGFKEFLSTHAVHEVRFKDMELVKAQEQADELYKKLLDMLPEEGKEALQDFEEMQSFIQAKNSILYYQCGIEDARTLVNYLNGGTYKK